MILIMSPEDIKQNAYNWNLNVDQTLPMPERVLWYSLREIYRNYKDAVITKAEGESQVEDAMKQYRIDSTVLALQKMQIAHHAQMWKEIEIAGSTYRLDKSIEHADAFVEAVYGFMPTV